MPEHEQIKCPRCSAEFECKAGSITMCPCSEIALSQAQREYIALNWEGCLCNKCLAEISTRS